MQVLGFLLQLAGAVLLLLYSVRMVSTGVERLAGPSLREIFRGTRQSVLVNVFAGGLVAVMLQSSTAVAVLVSGFAATGAMGVTGSLAVVLGADLGTALVVQFLSLNLEALIPALLFVGGILFLKFEERQHKQVGRILLGVAFLLLSLELLGEASGPIQESRFFPVVVQVLAGDPVTAMLGGALIAFLFHSSVASVLLFAVFSAEGVLPISAALPLVLGANVGSGCVAVWLTRNMHVKARRITAANLVFRAVGGVLALAALQWSLVPVDLLGGSAVRQLVNFHLLFNLCLVVLGLPFIVPLARAVKTLITEAPSAESARPGPRSALDHNVLDNTELAHASATRELLRMGEQLEVMFGPLMDYFDSATPAQIRAIRKMDESVNKSQTGIKLYLAKLNRGELTKEQSKRSQELMNFAVGLERVGDIICKDLLRLCETKHRQRLEFSGAGRKELVKLHARVMTNMRLALNVLVSEDLESARQLRDEKAALRKLQQRSRNRHLKRLGEGNQESIGSSDIHLEVIQGMEEINQRFIGFAYPVLARYESGPASGPESGPPPGP